MNIFEHFEKSVMHHQGKIHLLRKKWSPALTTSLFSPYINRAFLERHIRERISK